MLFAPTTTCRSLPGTPESNAIGLVYNPPVIAKIPITAPR